MTRDANFSCTICGRCCHDNNLPLTIDEAVAWIEDGGRVVMLCEATPWIREPASDDARASYIKRRSFPVISGTASVQVTVLLVATLSGACRNLGDDFRCRIYDRRPLVCRIYPAEINPFIALNLTRKVCPPEAWKSDKPLLSHGVIVDQATKVLVERSRSIDMQEVPQKRRLCDALGINVASLKEEGFVVHAFDQIDLLQALRNARSAGGDGRKDEGEWRVYTPWPLTLDRLRSVGVDAISTRDPDETYQYVAIGSTPSSLSNDTRHHH